MGRLRGILFDKDGTLFDFHKTWGSWTHDFIHDLAGSPARAHHLAEVMRYDLDGRGYHPDSPFIAGSVEDWMDRILPVLPELSRHDLLNRISESTALATQVPATPLAPLLGGFRAEGYRLGVATNDGIGPVTRQLRDNAIDHLFDFVAGYDSGFGPKPHPGMLLAFADHVALPPGEIAMIGDSTHDLEAALAAGMVRVAVLTGMATEDQLAPHADVVLPSIEALPGWIAARNATP